MSNAVHSPLPPELEPADVDERSIHAFRHGFPSPLVRWHFHHDYELHLIVDSAGKAFVGDHIGEFAPGQLVMIGPRLPHNWVSLAAPGTVVETRDCVIQFRENLLHSMAVGARELTSLLPLLERARRGIEFRGTVRAEAEAWFDDIIDSEGALRIGLLINFLERLSRERDYRLLSTAPSNAGSEAARHDKLERAIRYMTEHHANNVSIASVADLVGMSQSTFSRFFVKATGSSFARFLNRARVAHACELLSTTDGHITDICFAVGFSNVANFNRRFRELKGMTPREYRKQARTGHVIRRDDAP